MDFLIVVLLFIIFWKIKFEKDINKEYLSIKTSQDWKGVFALVVILHHLSQVTVDGVFFWGFGYVGYLAVAVFFFLSGYGLQKKHIMDSSYSKTFLTKRIRTIVIPYIIITMVYWGLHSFGGNIYSLKDVLLLFVQGKPIVKYSWYVINILFLYLSFYISMKITKKNHKFMILGAIVSYVIWLCFCINQSFGTWWYNSTQLFVVGIIWAIYEQRIVAFIKLHFNIVSIFVTVAFAVCFFFGYTINEYLISLIFNLMAAILFTVLVLMLSMKIQIGNNILDFIGSISFEMYLTHGLFIILCGNEFLNIKNNLLYSISVLLLTTSFSFVFHKLCKFLLTQYNRMWN